MKNMILKLIVKHFNVKGFLIDMAKDVADEALEKAVKSTKTPFDDMAKASLYPVIEEELVKIIEEKVDLNKWFKLDQQA